MKKRIGRILSVLLIILCAVAFAGCGKTVGTGNGKEVQVLSGTEEAKNTGPSAQNSKEKETESKKEKDETQPATQGTAASNAGQSQTQNAGNTGNAGYGGYSGGQSAQTPQQSGGQSAQPAQTPTEAPTQAPTEPPTQPPTEAPTQPPAPQYVVSITVDGCGYGGYGIMSSCTLSFPYQPSVYDALCSCGVGLEGSGYYVSGINGLREKEYGATSGWMYSVNGYTPMVSCGNYYLNSGDNVYWHYVGD